MHTVNGELDCLKHFSICILKLCLLILISAPVNTIAAIAVPAFTEKIWSINSSSQLQPLGGKYQRYMQFFSNHVCIIRLATAA